MSRLHKPTAQLDASGAFIKHPERKRPNEPKPASAVRKSPPKDFTDAQQAVWKELMKMLPPGVAKNSDEWAMRHMVILEERSRRADANPLIQFTDGQHKTLVQYMIHFGLTPASRAKIQADAPKAENKLAALLNRAPARPTSVSPFVMPASANPEIAN